VWRQPFGGIELAPECLQAVNATATLCESLGHEMVDATPPADFDYDGFVDAHADVLAANIVVSVDARLKVLGRDLRADDLEPAIRDGYDCGKSVSAAAYVAAINRFHAIGRMMDECLAGVDLLMTPTLVQLPALLGQLAMTGSFREFRRRMGRYSTFLAVTNASGQPSASLPTHWTASRLPIGTQVIARFGRDDTILRLAAQIEATGVWQPRKGAAA
jgi:amidase